ncbi:hypothetical protein L211DRAFT_814173 [Terfezia boudieri ATCC MYA-4762]|uniref:Hypervirulence associated protein TUDOR domain-containing protein n=1 Tax=Terfezia boudieri ATCC MYA-4762 TaxID=1051890 RepID=A0A3N4LNN8_9PEZI|nr:hypothetical protein L211DRAFT_814173 [Terfezia boudieri ATCC MYA-4762]
MSGEVRDKTGSPIHPGDHVETKYRGGKREGKVEKIVLSKEEAGKEGVKNPPKVIYHDQHGHRVAHNPQTLTKDKPDE